MTEQHDSGVRRLRRWLNGGRQPLLGRRRRMRPNLESLRVPLPARIRCRFSYPHRACHTQRNHLWSRWQPMVYREPYGQDRRNQRHEPRRLGIRHSERWHIVTLRDNDRIRRQRLVHRKRDQPGRNDQLHDLRDYLVQRTHPGCLPLRDHQWARWQPLVYRAAARSSRSACAERKDRGDQSHDPCDLRIHRPNPQIPSISDHGRAGWQSLVYRTRLRTRLRLSTRHPTRISEIPITPSISVPLAL